MADIRLEFEMRLPVARWLLSRGLSPVCEVQCLGNCDLVGVRFEEKPVRLVEMVAVELKMRDIAGVIRQCSMHAACCVSEVWAAMLPDVAARNRTRFVNAGIGLLSVTKAGVDVLAPAPRKADCDLSPWKNAMRRRRNEHEWRMKHENMRRAGARGWQIPNPSVCSVAGPRQR
jgi:hypothetical protein